MTSDPAPRQDGSGTDLSVIMGERRQLISLAYRLLGSLAEAEDAVQETYTRWYAMSPEQRAAIESPGGWLTRVASRICLDLLGSARARRERYVGEWIPEPVPDRTGWISGRATGGTDDADPADRVTLDESISMAFLVALEAMTPAQRVALILHDVFRYSFAEIAEITGRTPAACRELASVARRRIRAQRHPAAPTAAQAGLVRHFKHAWAAKDIDGLVRLLDPDAVFTADGGGLVRAALEPVAGRERIARYVVAISGQLTDRVTMEETTVNGQPGLAIRHDDIVISVYAFDVVGDHITHIWAVRNPDKLRPWTLG
ncbi:RNA polymerase sigma24 factor [Actinocatenispora thailandica]|uniref:RNA polymerase sigma24 factor n=1 Tax=Actinocatenispora thailandica TaxID=227318 RepID=A0A7R7DWL6_9ACTN|nr:RNA polymerase sigma factor SigJ [Actinocatenispora thailandica]BCJ39196.1 RNA polymerase sigma24 factor [Actinocatenispora thailandica]